MKTRIHAGTIEQKELITWKVSMKEDGFTKFWTWVCWVVRQHIQHQNSIENGKKSNIYTQTPDSRFIHTTD